MLGYLSADIICSEKRTVFWERSSRKTVSFKEEIMSKDKHPSIFSCQMKAIVFIILQIFFATRAVLKIGEYPRIFPSFSRGIFGHVTLLHQSSTSKNIWWIIIHNIISTWLERWEVAWRVILTLPNVVAYMAIKCIYWFYFGLCRAAMYSFNLYLFS